MTHANLLVALPCLAALACGSGSEDGAGESSAAIVTPGSSCVPGLCSAAAGLECRALQCQPRLCRHNRDCKGFGDGIERCGVNGTCLPSSVRAHDVDPKQCSGDDGSYRPGPVPSGNGVDTNIPIAYTPQTLEGGYATQCWPKPAYTSTAYNTVSEFCNTPAFYCASDGRGGVVEAGTGCSCPTADGDVPGKIL